jgi:hypothetical protein
LTRDQVEAIRERERLLFGDGGDVKRELPRLRSVMDREALRRLLPGYVRQFVESAADSLELRVDGDLDGTFALSPKRRGVLNPLWEVLEGYPADARGHLTVYRPKADDAVFVHPGEPVFERLRELVLDRFGPDALRGAAFVDPTVTEPYVVFVAELSLIRRPHEPIHNRLVAVKVDAQGHFEPCPVEHFMLLRGCDRFPTEYVGLASRATELEVLTDEFLRAQLAEPLLAERRRELRQTLPQREDFLIRGFDYQAAELAASRQRLNEKVQHGQVAAKGALERVKEQQRALERRKAAAIASLRAEPDELSIDQVSVIARALIVPSSVEAERERYDANVEAIAMQVARAFEEAAGATVRDVSTAPKARAAGLTDYPGFDLLAIYPSGERRAVEVKGRARTGDVEVSTNEWARACNLRQEYWLHVVFDAASARPRLVRVQDPFAKLLTKSGGVIVNDRDIIEVGETDWAEPSAGSPLPEVLRSLFWDYPFTELRWPTHRDLVIGRVMESGGTEAIAWIRKTVGDADLAAWIHRRDGRGLDARQLRFWQTVLDLPTRDADRWVKQAKDSAWGGRTGS